MDKNIHAGHRQRMRERFEIDGFSNFSEHEVLEFLLFFALPRINTNTIAHELIREFGNLENVLSASTEELMKVDKIGMQSAVLLKSYYETYKYLRVSTVKKGSDFSTVEGSFELIKNCFFNEDTENFLVFLPYY